MEKTSFRNQLNLLSHIEHKLNDDGTVNWKAMVPVKYFVINADKTDEKDISKAKDSELLILLQGFKEVAKIRGYKSIRYPTVRIIETACVAACEIEWIPNFETGNQPLISSGIGDATEFNTTGFGKLYLGPIAENRAFIRAVKAGLNIDILGAEELHKFDSTSNLPPEQDVVKLYVDQLKELLKAKKIGFNTLKQRLIRENVPNAETFNQVEDIPPPKILEFIEKIKALRS